MSAVEGEYVSIGFVYDGLYCEENLGGGGVDNLEHKVNFVEILRYVDNSALSDSVRLLMC